MTQLPTPTTADDFEAWIIHMEDALREFLVELPEDVRRELDYSPRSLDVIEGWLLDRYASPQEALAPSESRVIDGAARYIGETFRKNVGGHWTIDLENNKNVFFGVPVLTGHRVPQAPLSLATASTKRRSGTYLRTVLENTAADASPQA